VFALTLYAATIIMHKYYGSLECSVLCAIRIQPDALYLTCTTVHSYISKNVTLSLFHVVTWLVDDPSGNFSACYNVKEKRKCHQTPSFCMALCKKIGCENDSDNCQNAWSSLSHSQVITRVISPQCRYTWLSTHHTILGDFRLMSWLAPARHIPVLVPSVMSI